MAAGNLSCSSMAILRLHDKSSVHFENAVRMICHSNNLISARFGRNFGHNLKIGGVRHLSVPGESNSLFHHSSNIPAGQGEFISEQSTATDNQPDAVAFGTLAAEITPNTSGFFIADDEFDLDRPTAGFASIPEAVEDIRQGKMVIVVDDEDRENEGDLIMAAQLVTPEAMAFIVKHGTGIVCVSMKEEDLERLQLPLMVTLKENEEKLSTAFTVSVVCSEFDIPI